MQGTDRQQAREMIREKVDQVLEAMAVSVSPIPTNLGPSQHSHGRTAV